MKRSVACVCVFMYRIQITSQLLWQTTLSNVKLQFMCAAFLCYRLKWLMIYEAGRNRVTNEIETKMATNKWILLPIYYFRRFSYKTNKQNSLSIRASTSVFLVYSRSFLRLFLLSHLLLLSVCPWEMLDGWAFQTIIISIIVYEMLLSLVNCSYYLPILLSFGP